MPSAWAICSGWTPCSIWRTARMRSCSRVLWSSLRPSLSRMRESNQITTTKSTYLRSAWYEYGAGDPINNVDLDGRLLWCGWFTNSWTVYDWFWARGIGWVPLRCGTSTWGYKHIRGKHGWGWSDNNETLLTLAFGSRVQQGTAYVYRKNFSRWSWCGCYVIRWTRIVVVETRNRMGIITSYRRYY